MLLCELLTQQHLLASAMAPACAAEAARRGVAAVLSEPPERLVRVCICAPARASHTHTCNSGSAHGSRRGLSHGATVGSMRMYCVRKVRGVCVARGSQSASSGHWNAYASCPSYLPTCDVAISHFGNLTFSLMTRGGAAEIVCAEHCRVSPSPKPYVVFRFARSILHMTACCRAIGSRGTVAHATERRPRRTVHGCAPRYVMLHDRGCAHMPPEETTTARDSGVRLSIGSVSLSSSQLCGRHTNSAQATLFPAG